MTRYSQLLRSAERANAPTELEGKIEDTIASARAAARLAHSRLEKSRSQQTITVYALGALGVAGIVALGGLALTAGIAMNVRLLCVGLAALAVGISTVLLVSRAQNFGGEADDSIVAVVHSDKQLIKQMQALGRWVVSVEREPDWTARSLLTSMVAEAADAAAASRAREARIRAEARGKIRRHERIRPTNPRVIITTADDRKLRGILADISMSGAKVDGNFPGCRAGTFIMIGSTKAEVIRSLDNGIACKFAVEVPASKFDEDIVL